MDSDSDEQEATSDYVKGEAVVRGDQEVSLDKVLWEGFKNSSSIDKWNNPLGFTPPTH